MQVRISGPGAGAWAKYPHESLGWADLRLRWKSQPGRRVRTIEFTIIGIDELKSEIEMDREMIVEYPDDPVYPKSLADAEARLKRLLAGEEGMERRGVEHCLFVPKPEATRADAENAMRLWFRRNGDMRPVRFKWEKADWFPVPATLT